MAPKNIIVKCLKKNLKNNKDIFKDSDELN